MIASFPQMDFALLMVFCFPFRSPYQSVFAILIWFSRYLVLSLKHLNTVSQGIFQYANHSTFSFKPHCLVKLSITSFSKGFPRRHKRNQETFVYPNLLQVRGKCTLILLCNRNCTSLTNIESKQQVVPWQSFGRLSSIGN